MYPLAHSSLVLIAAALLVVSLAFPSTGLAEGEAAMEKGKAKEAAVKPEAPNKGDEPARKMRGKPKAKPQAKPQRSFPAGLAEARLVKEKAKELGVGQETLDKLNAMVIETRAKDDELREELLKATQKVGVLLDEKRPNEKAVFEAAAVASALTRQTRELRLHFSLKVRALLSDEQVAKFMEVRKMAMEARRKRGGQRPRR